MLTAFVSRCRRLDLQPTGGDGFEPLEAAEIPRFGKGDIERGDCRRWDGRRGRVQLRNRSGEAKVRRSQKREQRPAGEVGRHRIQRDVERRGIRFGGQRQRIERLEGNAGVGEHVAREIEIRQRPPDDERGPVQRRRPLLAMLALDAARRGDQLLFAIAMNRCRPFGLARLRSRHRHEDRQRPRFARQRNLLEIRERRVQPLEIAGAERRLGAQQIE